MSGHSPGPWSLGSGRRYSSDLIVFAPIGKSEFRFRVAHVCYEVGVGPRAEAEANAHLIAAAPDLLAALKSFVAETRAYQSPECDECPIFGPLLRAADAAIARAEGRP